MLLRVPHLFYFALWSVWSLARQKGRWNVEPRGSEEARKRGYVKLLEFRDYAPRDIWIIRSRTPSHPHIIIEWTVDRQGTKLEAFFRRSGEEEVSENSLGTESKRFAVPKDKSKGGRKWAENALAAKGYFFGKRKLRIGDCSQLLFALHVKPGKQTTIQFRVARSLCNSAWFLHLPWKRHEMWKLTHLSLKLALIFAEINGSEARVYFDLITIFN